MPLPTMWQRVLALKGKRASAGQINFADQLSATSQEFLDETNINSIVRRFKTRGILPTGNKTPPSYGDFSTVGDYMDAQQRFLSAREQFDTLPARLRAQLHNSPAEFLVWVADPANRDQATKLGLFKPPTPPVAPPSAPPAGSVQAPAPAPAPSNNPPRTS